jgi:hypothetical protein
VHHDYPGDALAIYVRDDRKEWVLKQRLSMVDLF